MRLDAFLFEKKLCKSRTNAAELIKAGLVEVNGSVCLKASFGVTEIDEIKLAPHEDYASAGSKKLQKAVDTFKPRLEGLTAADIGASNGGFTDVLLKNRVKKVYAVDVALCALPESILNSGRVVAIEKLNARYMTRDDIGELVDIATVDVSFISLKLILPAIYGILKEGGYCIALVKPQFELNKQALTKGGIVKSPKLREDALNLAISYVKTAGFELKGCTEAPIVADKNVEYLIYLKKN